MGFKQDQKELTPRSVILGMILSVVMSAANVYLGLKVGMTVTASIPAAVMATLVLRGLLRTGTIFEANQVQTAASAGEALAAGMIFTVPAFLMIGFWTSFNYWTTTLIAIAGGVLGVLFMIPMRKVFIVGDFKDLPYPEAKATAAVLEAGHSREKATEKQAWSLINGTIIGAAIQFITGFMGLLKSPIEFAAHIFGRVFYVGCDMSPALLGIGYIIGLGISFQVFLGGLIGWVFLLPLLSAGASGADAVEMAWNIWSTKTRYVGVGALVVGGCASIYYSRMGFVKAFLEIKTLAGGSGHVAPSERDISARSIALFSALCIASLVGVYFSFTNSIGITAIVSILMVILAFFFTAVANYIVAIVGNSNSPISGMNITAVLISGLLLLLFGYSGIEGMAAALGVAAVICCVAAVAGDSCNDLKTGHMIGASPFRQQIMEMMGVVVAAFAMAPILKLLHENTPGGIGGRELSAPQASLLASLVKGMFSPEGSLPWHLIGLGALIGIGLLVAGLVIDRRKLGFKIHVMPVAIGIYLPFALTLPMIFGGLLNFMAARRFKEEKEKEEKTRTGVLFSSGFIAGESLMGVGIALFASVGIKRMSWALSPSMQTALTVIAFFIMLAIFAWSVRTRKR